MVRQMNRFIALMDNYGRALELMYKSITAQGTAMQQYNEYIQSTEFQIKRLKAEFEGFFLVLNQNGGVIKSMIEYFADIMTFFRSFGELLSKNKGALVLFSTALFGIGVALTAMGSVIPAVLVSIYAVGKALGHTGNAIESSEEKFKKYADEQKDMVSNQKSVIKSTEDLTTRLDLMAKTEDGVIKNKQELNMWYEALETIQPNILDGLDKEKATYADLKAIIEQLTQAKKNDLAQSMANARADITKTYGEIGLLRAKLIGGSGGFWADNFPASDQARVSKQLKEVEGRLESQKKLYEELVNVERQPLPFEDDPNGGGGGGGATTATTKYTSALEDYFNILQKISNVESDLAKLETMKGMVSDTDALKITEMQVKKIGELIDLNKQLKVEQQKTKDNLIESLKPYQSIVKISDDYNSLIVDTKNYNAQSDASKEKIDTLVNAFDELRASMNSTDEQIIKLGQSLQKTLSDNLKTLTDTIIKDLEVELDNLNKQQQNAIDSINSSIADSNSYYDDLIAKKQQELDLYKQQVAEQERMLKLKKLEAEIEDVLNDKRFEIISGSGEKVLTYDKERYNELLEQKEELVREYEQGDIEDAMRAEIDALKNAKEETANQRQEDINKVQQDIDKKIKLYEAERDNVKKIQDSGINNLQSNIDSVKGLLNLDITNKESYVARMYELAMEMQSILQVFPGGSPTLPSLSDIKAQASSASQLSPTDQIKVDKQRIESELLNALANDAQRIGYSLSSGALTSNPSANQISARKYLEQTYSGGLSSYIQSQVQRYRGIGTYHNGGIVGGVSFNPKTEEISKLLKGEFVSSKGMLEQLPNTLGKLVSEMAIKQSSTSKSSAYNFYGDIKPNNFNDFINGIGFLTKAERGIG